MTSTQQPVTESVEYEIPTDHDDIISFVHRLGGPVDVVGYDAAGERVGVIVNPITDDEVEVIDPAGLAVRLVASPAPEDEDDGEAADGDLTPDRG